MNFGGMDVTHPINRIKAGVCALAVNVRAYLKAGFALRNPLSGALYTLSAVVQSIARMNDTTPQGPPSGYAIISSDGSGNLYRRHGCCDRLKWQQNLPSSFSAEPVSAAVDVRWRQRGGG